MKKIFDAFISYGRDDSKAFAVKLNERLTAQGLNVWFDQEDIPLAVDYQEQINDGIEKSHNFIFIIAPRSVNSPYCLKEIELAIKHYKRIIPLLHVEQINQETWQSRNPNKNEDDWKKYQAKGLHSSFPNMHPTIRKINWVYFRENIDDFESSLTSLLEIIDRHKDYVKNHTNLLVKALDWLRNQKQTNKLLIGSEREEGEKWLKDKFIDEQPPCLPTDLQCEFICESTKNANNLMTQVFLSSSDKDNLIKEKIGKTLMREGFTIWTNNKDLKTGSAFQDEINKGIEGADNLVYFISPDSLESEYCWQEIAHAFANNKRIIPLLIQETDTELIPSQLQKLQYIDLTGAEEEDNKYRSGIDKLLKELKTDASYYDSHKVLLVKAKKWQGQNCNPSILLRGYNLQYFEAWLKVAKQRKEHPPVTIQEEFISASLNEPKASSLEVFISYSRADSDLARRLNNALIELGKLTWFDQESIASGEDFQQEIYRGIETSDNFLFIISPKSVNSPYCSGEVEYAQKLNKRIVTILHQKVVVKHLHPALAKVQWLDFSQHGGEFLTNFAQLVRILDTDRDHVHNHSKWLQKAKEWEKSNKNADLLLRGSEFFLAQTWLKESEENNKQPLATELQKEFIQTSQTALEAAEVAEKRRQQEIMRLQKERTQEAEKRLEEEKKGARQQRAFLAAVMTGLIVSTALGIIAFFEYKEAKIEEIIATGKTSETLFVSNQKLDALVEAIRSEQKMKNLFLPRRDIQSQVENALEQAIYGVKEYNRLSGHDGAVYGIALSLDGTMIASASMDNTVKLWQSDGKELANLRGHRGSVNAVVFSPYPVGGGQRGEDRGRNVILASASADKTVKLWQWNGKKATLLTTLTGHKDSVNAVAFSSDGSMIASASKDKTVKIWRWNGKKATLLDTLRGDNQDGNSFNSVAFSPDGQLIAAGSGDKTIKLWKGDRTFLTTLEGHSEPVWGIAFSPDSQLIASGSEDKTIKLWKLDVNRDTYTNYQTLKGHSSSVWGVAFSLNGQRIVSGSADKTIRLWKRYSKKGESFHNYQTLLGHTDEVNAVNVSSDAKLIVSGSNDNTIRFWKPDSSLVTILFGHEDTVNAVDFSPDGKLIASGSADNTIKIWKSDGTFLKTLNRHEDKVYTVAFSPDGKLIASGSADKTIKLWKSDGTLLKTLNIHEDKVYAVAFSPDGKLIASSSADNTIKLWKSDGTLLKTLNRHEDEVYTVAFSPDGKLIASGSADNTIKLWQRDGKFLRAFEGHLSAVLAIDINSDGKLIASGSADNTIKIWKIDGTLLTTLDQDKGGHRESVLGIKFRPDGQLIASASVDNRIKIWKWDGKKATLETNLLGHSDDLHSIDFSTDGKTLVSGSQDKTLILWTRKEILTLNKLMFYSCDWVRDYLKNNSKIEKSDRLLCN